LSKNLVYIFFPLPNTLSYSQTPFIHFDTTDEKSLKKIDRELEEDSDDDSVEDDGFLTELGNSLAEAYSAILSIPSMASSGLDKGVKALPLPGHDAHLSQLRNHNNEEPSLFQPSRSTAIPTKGFSHPSLLSTSFLMTLFYSRSLSLSHPLSKIQSRDGQADDNDLVTKLSHTTVKYI